jgi:large subunit ribosomal protein L21
MPLSTFYKSVPRLNVVALAISGLSSTMALTMATTATKNEAFAVIMTGGKQYIVSVGDTLEVELLSDVKEGEKVTFDTVLMTDDGAKATVGAPTTGGKVTATYLGEVKGPKLSIIRYKAKSNRDRKIGHRQHYAKIKIESI